MPAPSSSFRVCGRVSSSTGKLCFMVLWFLSDASTPMPVRLDCADYVLGVPSALYRGYANEDAAVAVYKAAVADGCVFDTPL